MRLEVGGTSEASRRNASWAIAAKHIVRTRDCQPVGIIASLAGPVRKAATCKHTIPVLPPKPEPSRVVRRSNA